MAEPAESGVRIMIQKLGKLGERCTRAVKVANELSFRAKGVGGNGCEGGSCGHCKVEHMLDGWVPR